jgi:hypothetical protein
MTVSLYFAIAIALSGLYSLVHTIRHRAGIFDEYAFENMICVCVLSAVGGLAWPVTTIPAVLFLVLDSPTIPDIATRNKRLAREVEHLYGETNRLDVMINNRNSTISDVRGQLAEARTEIGELREKLMEKADVVPTVG